MSLVTSQGWKLIGIWIIQILFISKPPNNEVFRYIANKCAVLYADNCKTLIKEDLINVYGWEDSILLRSQFPPLKNPSKLFHRYWQADSKLK